jgi:peptide-methionine (R)-S-oxide reductase
MKEKIKKSDEEWKKELSDEEFRILRKKGTEPPFTGKYHDNKKKGRYFCAGCGTELFSSDTKYDSGSGWPSFYSPIDDENVETKPDLSLGMKRTEILCSKCGGHLGHVFRMDQNRQGRDTALIRRH